MVVHSFHVGLGLIVELLLLGKVALQREYLLLLHSQHVLEISHLLACEHIALLHEIEVLQLWSRSDWLLRSLLEFRDCLLKLGHRVNICASIPNRWSVLPALSRHIAVVAAVAPHWNDTLTL